jgi:hypothetical protein
MYVCVVVLGKYFLLCDGPESPAPDLAFRWGLAGRGRGRGTLRRVRRTLGGTYKTSGDASGRPHTYKPSPPYTNRHNKYPPAVECLLNLRFNWLGSVTYFSAWRRLRNPGVRSPDQDMHFANLCPPTATGILEILPGSIAGLVCN